MNNNLETVRVDMQNNMVYAESAKDTQFAQVSERISNVENKVVQVEGVAKQAYAKSDVFSKSDPWSC